MQSLRSTAILSLSLMAVSLVFFPLPAILSYDDLGRRTYVVRSSRRSVGIQLIEPRAFKVSVGSAYLS